MCPFDMEVGDPPRLTRCRLGFPGCNCMDKLVGEATDAEAVAVRSWWADNS